MGGEKKIRRILHSFLPDPEEFLCSSSYFIFPSRVLTPHFCHMGRGRIFWPVVNSLLFLSSHRSAKGKKKKREKKNDQKINVFPKNNFSERSAKEKGFRFQDLVISLEMVRYLVSFFVLLRDFAALLLLWLGIFIFHSSVVVFVEEETHDGLTYIYLYIYKFFSERVHELKISCIKRNVFLF